MLEFNNYKLKDKLYLKEILNEIFCEICDPTYTLVYFIYTLQIFITRQIFHLNWNVIVFRLKPIILREI